MDKPQVDKMISLISQEKLDSRVSEIISPEMYLPNILYLPHQVIVRQFVMGLIFLMLVEVDVSGCDFQGSGDYV